LEVVRLPQLNVHPDVLRESTHIQLRLLERRQVKGVAQERVEALRVLHGGQERKAGELREPVVADGRAEMQVTELLEALLAGHAFILLQRVVPCLGCIEKVVQGEPDVV
jgi:hypothetical protein